MQNLRLTDTNCKINDILQVNTVNALLSCFGAIKSTRVKKAVTEVFIVNVNNIPISQRLN